MKISLATGLLLFLIAITGHAQGVYSTGNLEKSSPEKLDLYLTKAHNLKKTGAVFSIAGPLTAITGLALTTKEASFPLGFGMLIAGTGALRI